MTATAKQIETTETLEAFVRECMDAVGGDWDATVERCMKIRESDRHRVREFENDAWLRAFRYTVHQLAANDRRPALADPDPEIERGMAKARKPNPDNAAGIQYAIQRRLGCTYHEPLAGGFFLGNATREQVLAQAELHSKLASSNAHKARYFEMIAARMPETGNKTVRQCLKEAELKALFEKAAQ